MTCNTAVVLTHPTFGNLSCRQTPDQHTNDKWFVAPTATAQKCGLPLPLPLLKSHQAVQPVWSQLLTDAPSPVECRSWRSQTLAARFHGPCSRTLAASKAWLTVRVPKACMPDRCSCTCGGLKHFCGPLDWVSHGASWSLLPCLNVRRRPAPVKSCNASMIREKHGKLRNPDCPVTVPDKGLFAELQDHDAERFRISPSREGDLVKTSGFAGLTQKGPVCFAILTGPGTGIWHQTSNIWHVSKVWAKPTQQTNISKQPVSCQLSVQTVGTHAACPAYPLSNENNSGSTVA